MALQEVQPLRGRISKVANDLDNLTAQLGESLTRIDGAIFGYHPTASDTEKESPVADSLEGEVGRIERLLGRLTYIAKDAAELRHRIDGAGAAQSPSGYQGDETRAPAVAVGRYR